MSQESISAAVALERLAAAERTIQALMDRIESANDRNGQQRNENALATQALVRRRTEQLSRMNEGLMRDAVRRRQLDRIIREMQKLSNLAGWELTPDTGSMEVTEHFNAMFELSGKTVPTLEVMLTGFTASSAIKLATAIERAHQERQAFDEEYSLAPTAGADRIVRVVGSPLVENGVVVRIYGVVKDITREKMAQAQLAQAQRLESIGQLAAGIAHEINTPTQYVSDNVRFLREQFGNLMIVVDQYATVLSRDMGDAAWQERWTIVQQTLAKCDFEFLRQEIPLALDQSLEGLSRVSSIVRAMKDFSHPGSAAMEPADLNKAIASTVEVSRSRWKYAAELEMDMDPSLPLVPCLVAELNQVILNLIINAADALVDRYGSGEPSKGVLGISTRLLDEIVEIRVRDNAGGIPEHLRPRIFEPFFTTKEAGRGTGQGLSICRAIVVKKHAGELSFESTSGVGTTFIIKLPIRPEYRCVSAEKAAA